MLPFILPNGLMQPSARLRPTPTPRPPPWWPPQSPVLMVTVLLAAALVGSSPAAVRGADGDDGPSLSKFDAAHIPWYNTEGAGQPLQSDALANHLPELLHAQQANQWVTVFMFSADAQRWVLNCVYSYIKFGEVNSRVAPTLHVARNTHSYPC
eukprot:361461-Chlamydomonas_euryale.AAC.4